MLDPDHGLVHLLLVHDHVAVLGPAQHVVDTDDALLVLILGVTDQRGTHLHPGVASSPVQEPEICGHHLTLLNHCKNKIELLSELQRCYSKYLQSL